MRLVEILRLDEQKVHVVDALSKYKDDPDIYITFSEVMKVGINPKSKYETPLGIYTYPLVEMWEEIVTNKIPFASDRPFIHVLAARGDVTELSQYTESDLSRDIEIIRKKFAAALPEPAVNNGSLTTSLEHEYIQVRLINRGIQPHTNTADNEYDKEYTAELKALRSDPIAYSNMQFNLWAKEAYFPSKPGSAFWNITRNVAMRIAAQRRGKASIIWNAVFRALNYSAFSDKSGIGFIHSSEPIQAVFLSKNALQHIATFDNVRPKTIKIDEVVEFRSYESFLSWAASVYQAETKIVDYWMRTLSQQWQTLRETGQSKNFKMTCTPDQFDHEIRKDLEVIRMVYPLMHGSQHALPVLIYEMQRTYLDTAHQVLLDVLSYGSILESPRLIRMLFSKKIISIFRDGAECSFDEAWTEISQRVLKFMIRGPRLAASIFDNGTEASLLILKKMVHPLSDCFKPETITDDGLKAAIETAYDPRSDRDY